MLHHRKQVEEAGKIVLFNGRVVSRYVFAFPGERCGYIVCQEFPEGWHVGDPMPEEKIMPGNVSIAEITEF